MASWFSKLLGKESKGGSAQDVRLCTARFRHFLRQYGRMMALQTDAAEKQSGEFILDRAYILALSDKAFEAAVGMVYDLNVLARRQYAGLYDAVDALREKTAQLIESGWDAAPSASEQKEEPEYRLLREMRQVLFQADSSAAAPGRQMSDAGLFGIVESAAEAAAHTVAESMRPLRPARSPANGQVFAPGGIPTAVLDLMGTLTGLKELRHLSDPLSVDSAPARELLKAFFTAISRHEGSQEPAEPAIDSVVVVALEDSMNTIVFHREGYSLLNAYMSQAPESNHIYCRFQSEAARSPAASILARLGFSVSGTQHGTAGWLASQPEEETAAKLNAVGKMAAFLLRPSTAGIRQEENGDVVNSFFRMHF